MHRRRLLGVLGAGTMDTLSGERPAKSAEVPPLSVRIVPTSYQKDGGRTIALYQSSQHFYVVITNSSGKLIRLWSESCSWGYSSLSFEVTDEVSRSIAVKKVARAWTKNAPVHEVVPPDGHWVREINFNPTKWANSPMPEAGKSRAVRLKAVYSIPAEPLTKAHGIWTGEISSPNELYELKK
jgi:hypothetical protein